MVWNKYGYQIAYDAEKHEGRRQLKASGKNNCKRDMQSDFNEQEESQSNSERDRQARKVFTQ